LVSDPTLCNKKIGEGRNTSSPEEACGEGYILAGKKQYQAMLLEYVES